jgi:hypothetical protein
VSTLEKLYKEAFHGKARAQLEKTRTTQKRFKVSRIAKASDVDSNFNPVAVGALRAREAGGAHGVVLDLKAGASAPPLFGLRHFQVELAGLRGVFVARLRRGNFFVCTSGSFFWTPEPSRSVKWASTCPLLF